MYFTPNGVIVKYHSREEGLITLREDIRTLAGITEAQAAQIPPEVEAALVKIYKCEALTRKEEGLTINPLEAGIVLSINSKRAINHRYVKELTRSDIGKQQRLEPVRTAGKTFLYRLGDVHHLGAIQQRPGAGNRKPRVKQEQSEKAA